MTDLNEKDLIRKAKQGDMLAFGELILKHEKIVYNLALRMMNHSEDAQDIAQEVFLKAYRSLANFDERSAFSTWLYRLTTNVCIDFLRSRKRHDALSLTTEEEEDRIQELEISDEAPLPEEQLLYGEQKAQIRAAMAQLDEEARTILALRVVEDLPYEQIAEVLDLNTGTVKSRLARARMKLKKILEEKGNKSVFSSSKRTERGVDAYDL